MDPNHRDRVAFLRIASGEFKRNMKLKQSGTGKTIGVHNPILFFASERETVDEAWPGDIIGIPNHGVLRVGDTLSESGQVVFTGIPNFAPEILRRVRLGDPMKQKHLASRPGIAGGRRCHPSVQAGDRLAMDCGRGGRAAIGRAQVAAGGGI
jgi:peptide chain release factor 3